MEYKLKIADIIAESVVDGKGIRLVVFFQGCKHKCIGCHNPESWSFDLGTEYTIKDLGDKILSGLTPLHRGITFSGGDSMFQEEALLQLIKYIKSQKNNFDIWLYTGFTFEEIIDSEVLKYIDVLVDGRFILEQRDLTLVFRGSKNQRLIDMKKTIKSGEIELFECC